MSEKESVNEQPQDENKLIAQRREKLQAMRVAGNAFPNDFRRDTLAAELHRKYGESSAEQLDPLQMRVKLAGRMMAKRVMGKASFTSLQDMSAAFSYLCSATVWLKIFTTNNLKNGMWATSSALKAWCLKLRPVSYP